MLKNEETAEPIGDTFLVTTNATRGKVNGRLNVKNLVFKTVGFYLEICECAQKNPKKIEFYKDKRGKTRTKNIVFNLEQL